MRPGTEPMTDRREEPVTEAIEDTEAFKIGFHRGVRVGYYRGKAQAEREAQPLSASLDVERLAALEHEQWIEWASTLLAAEPGISPDRRERWQRLIAAPYAGLTEAEKHQDRIYAEKIVALSAQPSTVPAPNTHGDPGTSVANDDGTMTWSPSRG